MIDAAGPEAVRELVSNMRQRRSATLRFSAACKLLDLGQQQAERRRPGDDGDGLLDRVAQALKLRGRAAAAVDAVPGRGEPVTLEHAPQSPQPSDK